MDFVTIKIYVFIHVFLQILSLVILWIWVDILWLFYGAYVINYSLFSSSIILFYTATSKAYGIEISLKLFWVVGWASAVCMGVVWAGEVVFNVWGFGVGYLVIGGVVGVNLIIGMVVGYGE